MAICTQCSNTLPELPGLAAGKLEEIAFELGMSQKIEAIRLLREAIPGIGLKEAKDYVDCPHKAPTTGAPTSSPPSAVPGACPSCGKPFPLPSRADEVARELAAGNKIMAIKIVRELTGLGLKEAKDYVECPHTTAAATTPSSPPTTAAPTTLGACTSCGKPLVIPGADGPRAAAFAEALGRGAKIDAIKIVREVTGWGLKEAKDFVDCPHASPSVRFEPMPTSPPPAAVPPPSLPARAEPGIRTAACALLVVLFIVMPLTATVAIFFVARATSAEQQARREAQQAQREQEEKAASDRKARLQEERAKQATLAKLSCPNCHKFLPQHALLDSVTRAMVVDHLKAGKKIEAIKAVRAATKWGLAESKKYVDCPHELPE
jgi:ribosomal protein L7/L12